MDLNISLKVWEKFTIALCILLQTRVNLDHFTSITSVSKEQSFRFLKYAQFKILNLWKIMYRKLNVYYKKYI